MRILLSKEDMKTCDQNTIEGFGVPSCVLMERAALACPARIRHAIRKKSVRNMG